MSSVLSKFDTNASFWEAVPQFKTIEPFKTLYKEDHNRNKTPSSKIMWAIAQLIELDDNKLALYPEEERKMVIASDYLEKPNFKWEKYEQYIEKYKELMLTPAERALYVQRKKTEERNNFLTSVEYTMANAKELDSLLANTEKFLEILKKLESSVAAEKSSSGSKKGGREESLSEKGII
jgi:hypothetical protein